VPYLRPPLSKELWFTASTKLALKPEEMKFTDWHGNEKPLAFENSNFYRNFGVEMILGCEAVDFDLEKRQVGLSDGQVLQFDRLLIATGAQPKTIDASIDESIREHVSTFRSVSDFVKLYNLIKEREGQRVVVVGGGFLGSELAVSLTKIGNEMGHSITQVFPEDGHMGLVFPKYLSQWTTEKVSQLGVKVKSGRSVSSIVEGKNDSVVNVVLDNGEELPADHVIVAVGVEPNLAKPFIASLPIDKEFGGLEADKYLQVVPGVFAAGDVVSYLDPVLECRRRTEHFDHAVLSGKLAGINMTKSNGLLEPYSNQSMFW
jgi:programmed cell death 8 (apoptosis-inducing factor)